MMAVVMVALVMSGSMLGWRAFQYDQTFRYCDQQERGWRSIAARRQADPAMAEFAVECAEYYGGLAQKYHRARWLPWLKLDPDPPAPGAELAAAAEKQARALKESNGF